MNTCTTKFCHNVAKFLMIKDGDTVRYCLPCINKVKESFAKELMKS